MKQTKRKLTPAFLLVFFVFLSSFFILISSGNLDSEDGWLYASVARNIYYRHQIASAPDEYPTLNVHMNTTLGKDGVWRAPGSLGYSLSLVPAVALSDALHRYYGVAPPDHFPLQHDWSFHLFASLTNALWGAILGVFILLFANELRFSIKQATILAISTMITTNLLVLTKLSFAHMMFATCLVGSFYFVKVASKRMGLKKIFFFALASLSYLGVVISYNVTYYLPLIPLVVYAFLVEKPIVRKRMAFLLIIAVIGGLILFTQTISNLFQSTKIGLKILFEGVWGFIFSSGKSIFLYSPPLLLIPLFWHKMKKELLPEIIAFSLLAFFYLYFVGSSSITDHGLPVPIWHGGMAWGPRYLSVLIPFGMILVFHIASSLNTLQKRFIVVPLLIVGIWVQVVGASVIYLLQYRDIPYNIFIGKAELTVYDYASFIPRYSPLWTLSREFIHQLVSFPKTVQHGRYSVHLYDGFDMPYRARTETYRGFRKEGHISFINSQQNEQQTILLTLANTPDTASSSAIATMTIVLNNSEVQQFSLPPNEDTVVTVETTTPTQYRNELTLRATYDKPTVTPHVHYIKKMSINGIPVNLGSLDYPDISTLGNRSSFLSYHDFDPKMKENWTLWDLRARVNERTLNYWWIKNLYYWDRPQGLLWGFFFVNLTLCVASGVILFKAMKKHL